MTDIVERLRHWSHGLTYDPAAGLMHEAASEIERLRSSGACPHVRGTVTQFCALNFTLTDEEREAVKWCRDNIIPMSSSASAFAFIHTATLRKLLERLA